MHSIHHLVATTSLQNDYFYFKLNGLVGDQVRKKLIVRAVAQGALQALEIAGETG